MIRRGFSLPFSLAALPLAMALLAARPASAEIPTKASDAVLSPGRSIASGDDSTAIVVNPANLAFLPAPELRWNWSWMDAASPLPNRGHAVALALPIWIFATGVRIDWMDPPSNARLEFPQDYHWVRWDLALRAGDVASFGTTIGWSFSDAPALDDAVSLTSGLTVRPSPYVSLAALARDWNHPQVRSGARIERSYEAGLAVRPVDGRRALELGVETAYYSDSNAWVPRATAGLDVPRLGRLHGGLTLLDPAHGQFLVTAGLDLNLGFLQAGGGGIFGSAPTKQGAGFFATAAIRAYREPGVVLPTKVARIRIDATPGVRGHVRLLRKLWRLADDKETGGVLLAIRADPASSPGHAEELGDALRLLRVRGKKVICALEDAGARSLYVCSQADRIAMNPAGGLRFAGLSSKYYYLGGLLEKLGVRAEFVRIGVHKSAAEQLTLDHGTDVARADHQETLDALYRTFLHDVGGGRKIAMATLRERIAKGPFLASEARDAGLIDTLAYADELGRVVDDVLGRHVRVVDDSPMDEAPERWGDAPKVAVIYLSGDMIDGQSQNIPFIGIKLAGSYTIARALKRAREDASVKAVVFRIETGGGSSLAADVILREAILTARKKPLIVSMGSAAASGGYYASVAAKTIYANPSTITGSIGIFYGKVDVQTLLNKLGVTMETVRTNPRADAESIFRPFTDDEREALGIKVKQFYDTFVGRVADGRHMSPAAVDAVGRGKVWTGQQALPLGLVDKLGGLREALAEARALGHLSDDAPIVESPEERDSLLGFVLDLAGLRAALGADSAAVISSLVPPAMIELARALAPFMVYEPSRPLARMELIGDPSFGGAGSLVPNRNED
jgi:protease-4